MCANKVIATSCSFLILLPSPRGRAAGAGAAAAALQKDRADRYIGIQSLPCVILVPSRLSIFLL